AKVLRGTFLATTLKDAGFATAAVTANPAAGREEGFADGFDAFDQLNSKFKATQVTDHALALEADAPKDQRLFLWVHYIDPHSPYRAPKKWRTESQKKCDKLVKVERGRRRANVGGHSKRALSDCGHAYDAEIAYTDDQVGRLLKGLRKAGRLDNAIVIFTSDHGENFGEWGAFYGHGVNVHDAATRVPLIVAGSGIPKGERVTRAIGLHDLAPTMLALMEVPTSKWAQMSGASYAGVLDGSTPGEKDVPLAYAQSGGALLINYHKAWVSGRPRTGYCVNKEQYSLCWKGKKKKLKLYDRSEDPKRKVDVKDQHPEVYAELLAARDRWSPGAVREQSVSDGRFKLVERPRFEGGYSRVLYDLESDRLESTDVHKQQADANMRLGEALTAWADNIPGYEPIALNPEEEAQLRALGYID
ncbi:MAG: sulfatase, partial [Polyangiales bacterium]